MIVEIVETTDNKYIGLVYDTDKPLKSPDGITFNPTKIENVGDGYYRYSNSNYVLLAKEVV